MVRRFVSPLSHRGGGGINLLKAVFFSIFCFLFVGFFGVDAHAMTKHTIPRKVEGLGAYYPGNDFGRAVDLSMKTYVRHEWHGINGTTMVSTYESPNVANTKGSMLFLVPTNRSAFDYKNCLDIYFENVGSFQGRVLNARMSVDSVKYGPYTPNGKYNVSYSSNPTGIFLLQPYAGPEMFFGRSDQQEWFPGLEQRYDAVKDITITLTITYADTGEVANFPFYQYVNDIDNNDVWCTYGAQEGITFGSGFTDELYVYDVFRCSVNGRTVKVPNDGRNHNYSDFYMPPPVPGATSGEHKSDDKRVAEAGNFCNACWGATTNGRFTTTFHGSNAVASMNIRSPWLESKIIQKPTKSGITPSSTPETMYWNIAWYLPDLKSEILSPFSTLTFTDVIPSGQTYSKCVLKDADGNDITNQASVSYNLSTRTVSVSLSSSYLRNASNYGKKIYLWIYCDWNSGVTEASNTALITFDGNPIETPESSVHKYEKTNVALHKFVLNKKDSYGPGDEIEFLLVIDTASFDDWVVMPSDYEDKIDAGWWPQYSKSSFFNEDTIKVGVWACMSKPVLTDIIPDGLELVGEPVANSSWSWRNYNPAHQFISHDPPYTKDEMLYTALLYHKLYGFYFRDNGVSKYGCPIDKGTKGSPTKFDDLIYAVEKFGPVGFGSVSDVFSGINWDEWKNIAFHGTDKYWYDCYPSNLVTDYGPSVSYTPNKIQIQTVNDTLFTAWNSTDCFGANFGSSNPHFDDISWGTNGVMGETCIYYKCRVTGTKTNVDVTNVSNFSCEAVGVSMEHFNNDYFRNRIVVRQPLSAEASATVHLGGYEVTTEVVNGTIDEAVYDIAPGSNVGIGYERAAGHYLSSVEVDGTPVSVSDYDKLYYFRDINRSHHIKVVYERGYDITTEAVHGLIDAPYYGVKPGDNKLINYVPEDGYMIGTITVDGQPVPTAGHVSSYLFSNVQANHHIKVVFIPKHKITTSIVHGTITPTVTNIPPGENRTITYSPDSGYYVKSVTVDDNMLGASDLKAHLSSYVFLNIQGDHKIHVVCAPYPVITITKQIDTSDVVFAKGAPVFSFKVTGTDYLGSSHTYYREIAWPKGSVSVASKSVSLRIPPGQYMVSELVSNDWTLQSVSAGSNASVSRKTLTVDTRNADTASGTFLNKMTDWSKYTENGERINPLK